MGLFKDLLKYLISDYNRRNKRQEPEREPKYKKQRPAQKSFKDGMEYITWVYSLDRTCFECVWWNERLSICMHPDSQYVRTKIINPLPCEYWGAETK